MTDFEALLNKAHTPTDISVSTQKLDMDFGLEQSDVSFPVTTRDIQIVGRQPGCTLPVSTHKAVIRTDKDGTNPRGIGIVGRDYKVLKHRDFFSAMEKSISQTVNDELLLGAKVATQTSFDGAWVKREYVFPRFADELQTSSNFKTKIGFRIIAWNSYDGSSSAGMASGLIDWFCTNGMVSGAMVDMTKRRHTSGLTADTFAAQIEAGARKVEKEIETLRIMANTDLDFAAAEKLLQSKFSETRAKKLMERVYVEAEVRGANVFALQSALTYYSSHNSDEFSVRNTGADNIAKALNNREAEIAKVMPAVYAMAA